KAVVLAGDLDCAPDQILDRVVGAVVTERKLVGLEADRPAHELVTKADSVDGNPADELADNLDDVVQRGRIARSVGEQDRVRFAPEQLLRGGGARMELNRRAAGAEL